MKNPAEWDFCTVFGRGIDIDLLGHDIFWLGMNNPERHIGFVGTLKTSRQSDNQTSRASSCPGLNLDHRPCKARPRI